MSETRTYSEWKGVDARLTEHEAAFRAAYGPSADQYMDLEILNMRISSIGIENCIIVWPVPPPAPVPEPAPEMPVDTDDGEDHLRQPVGEFIGHQEGDIDPVKTDEQIEAELMAEQKAIDEAKAAEEAAAAEADRIKAEEAALVLKKKK